MRTNLNWTAGKETKFKEFSIYLMISKGFNFNVAQVSETTSTIIGFQLSIFVSIFCWFEKPVEQKLKVLPKTADFLAIVLLSIGFHLKEVVCFWIFGVFISSSGFIFQLYFCEFVMDFFVVVVVAVTLWCAHPHMHAVWPIVSISLFLLLDYYDYYYIKFSNQLEQCWVRVCLSACVRAASGREGRRHPTHSNRPSSFCDKNSNS